MKAKLLIVALVSLALATSGFATCTGPGFVAIIVNVALQLTDDCSGGTPLPDGSAIVQVINADDGTLCDSLCGFPNFGYELPINGEMLMGAPGFFGFDPAFGNGSASDPAHGFQCKVVGPCVGGFQAVWLSNVFYGAIGPQEVYIESWTCTMEPCGPSCEPTLAVWFPNGYGPHFESACVTLCEGSVCLIYTGPLDCCDQGQPRLNRFPLYTITPGCEEPPQPHDPVLFCNDPNCPPAHVWNFTDWEEDNIPPYQSPANVVYVDDGIHLVGYYYVFALAYAGEEGCVCVHFDFKLPVEMGEMDLAFVDNAVKMTWNTASESNLDQFIISRNDEEIGTVRATNEATSHEYSFVDENFEYGATYTYKLEVTDLTSNRQVLFTESITPSEQMAVVTEYKLHQNFPNPFNPSTSIRFDLVEANFVTLKIYNATGQEVATLVNGDRPLGVNYVNFDAANLTSGLYFYTVKIGDVYSATKKMLLVK